MEFLKIGDSNLFSLINQGLTHPLLDIVMAFLSNSIVLSFLLVAGSLLVWKQRKRNLFVSFLLPLSLSLAASDLVAYRILKPFAQRLRPCYEQGFPVRLMSDSCGGYYGFPSNHSGNAMTVAVSYSLFVGRMSWPLIGFAFLIGYSRVYMGVHYPGDVLAGFVLGGFMGLLVHFCLQYILRYRKKWKW